MLVTALKDFPFSRNGIHIERAQEGKPVDVPDDLLIGLIAAGNVAMPDGTTVTDHGNVDRTGNGFDPSTATVEELRAYLTEKSIKFHPNAGLNKLRALCE